MYDCYTMYYNICLLHGIDWVYDVHVLYYYIYDVLYYYYDVHACIDWVMFVLLHGMHAHAHKVLYVGHLINVITYNDIHVYTCEHEVLQMANMFFYALH